MKKLQNITLVCLSLIMGAMFIFTFILIGYNQGYKEGFKIGQDNLKEQMWIDYEKDIKLWKKGWEEYQDTMKDVPAINSKKCPK